MSNSPTLSDSTVKTLLNQIRNQSPGAQLRFDEDEVVLRGRVTSYFEKQWVQETVRQARLRPRIQNELEVTR